MRLLLALILICAGAFCQSPKAYRVGDGVSAPGIVSKFDPEYSEEARKAKLVGGVRLRLVVGVDGRATDIQVLKPLGLGLDQQAVEAVSKWQFRPGVKDGMPVPVLATVETNFRLSGSWRLTGVAFETPDRGERPTLIRSPYPSAQTPDGEQGSVSISCEVNRDGDTEELHIEKSSNPALESAAIAIVKGWKFRPGTQDGNPIPVRCTFDFELGGR